MKLRIMKSGKTSNNMYYSEEALKAQDGIVIPVSSNFNSEKPIGVATCEWKDDGLYAEVILEYTCPEFIGSGTKSDEEGIVYAQDIKILSIGMCPTHSQMEWE